jgi:hypothetical protein
MGAPMVAQMAVPTAAQKVGQSDPRSKVLVHREATIGLPYRQIMGPS